MAYQRARHKTRRKTISKLPPICDKCQYRETCQQVCKDIDIIADGNKALRERYLSYNGDRQLWRDYKQVLISKQRQKQQSPKEIINRIRQIEDHKGRLIIAARHARLTINQIATILNITPQAIYKYLKSIQVDTGKIIKHPKYIKKTSHQDPDLV